MYPSSNTPTPSTRFTAQGNVFAATHSSNKEYVRLSQSKAAREARGLSPAPVKHEGKHPLATKERTRKIKSKIDATFNGVDMELLNPAGVQSVMFSLKYSGSNKRRFELAPNDDAVNEHFAFFETYMSEQTGCPIKLLWFKDTNMLAQGIHFHVLMFPQGPLKDEAQFGLTLEQIIHEEWAIASGQFDKDDDFDPEHKSSPISHVKHGDFKSTADAVAAFAIYEGKKKDEATGKWRLKFEQKKTDQLWLMTGNYRVKWAGLSEALTPAKLNLDVEIKCDCGVSDAYFAAQKFSAAERKLMDFPSRVNEGETVLLDTARFSLDFLRRGATEFGKVSPELIAAIETIAEAHADCSVHAPVTAGEPTDTPGTPDVFIPAEATRLAEIGEGVEDVVREARIQSRAKVHAPRVATMAEGAAEIDADDLSAFAGKSLMEQVEEESNACTANEEKESSMTDINKFLTIGVTIPTSRQVTKHAPSSPEMKDFAWLRLDERLFELQHGEDGESFRGLRADRDELTVNETERTPDHVTVTVLGKLVPRRSIMADAAL